MRSASADADRPARGGRPAYPPARRSDIVDTYHGTSVPDPYRWLEDASSPETAAWVDAQNALTRSRLDGPWRDALASELAALYDYPRTSVPEMRGGRVFFTFNSGLRDQPILYVQDGLDAEPRVLLDPNGLSPDGTVALTAAFVSHDGARIAYGLSKGGSDRQDVLVIDVATGEHLPDCLRWLKFASIAWTHDGSGFYYTRFPEPGSVPPGDEHYFPKVWHHRLGTPQGDDELVFERPSERETVFQVDVSDDDRWAVITAYRGASDRSEVYAVDRTAPGTAPRPLFTGFHSAYRFIGESGGRLFFVTDADAPRRKVIALDPTAAGPRASDIVPESTDTLNAGALAADRLVVSRLHDASDRIALYTTDGAPRGEIPLPGIGSVTGLSGRRSDPTLFLGFWSFTQPPASFRYDFRTAALVPFDPSPAGSAKAIPATVRSPTAYETRQVWFRSKDGTRVSMFLVHRAGLPADGRRPVLLTGYGGFNINMTPSYYPRTFTLLDRGGIFAVPQLRGGGEYGEAWHEAGMLERKHNVFDDFIAAAEWLVASGYASPGTLAIEGGSNGGLLTAAVMLRRPDLFGAVVCRVPVADMLRYHLFTVGRFWIAEYGCADDPAQFRYLVEYSPYHNIRSGVRYPPTLITTADTDDRVAPGMAKKLAARLQAEADGGPFLIRIETRAGHGAGKPVSKMIQEDADILTFLFAHLEGS